MQTYQQQQEVQHVETLPLRPSLQPHRSSLHIPPYFERARIATEIVIRASQEQERANTTIPSITNQLAPPPIKRRRKREFCTIL